ncbi:YciI family protein [Actinotalea sp. C106]|uniref:YciI family protein n=1 Tax=Actinotalea sp. C106 TaxID=2908644 RepID=UPI002028EF07|nr:YciI family protein [Actinotalea sp. C106]
MKFLISVIDEETSSATPTELAAVDAFNERLRAAGYWIFAGGLVAPSTATVVDHRGAEEALLTDGPLHDTKEHVSGFWIIDAPDPNVALELAAEGSKHCNRKVELRAFLGD